MMRLAFLGLILLAPSLVEGAQADGVTPRYGDERGTVDKIYTEQTMTLSLKGTEEALAFVRTLHHLLSMEKLVIRAEGTRRVTPLKSQRYIYDEARVEMRYDDEDYEYDYTKGTPPVGGDDKLLQMMWFIAAGGKNYRLTPEGEYTSFDKNQDHTGEAMDLISLGVTRMPDGPVKEGDSYVKEFRGKRSEKGKSAKFAFRQTVKVEKIEERDGKKVATLGSLITGKLVGGEKDPNAEEAWTKVSGVTRTQIEIGSGRVLSSEGKGVVTAYWKGPSQDGGTNEITIKFGIAGKTTVE